MFIVTVKAKVEASGRLVLCLLGPNTQHPQAGVTLRIPAGEVEEFIAVVSDLPKIRNSKATYPINKSPFVCGHDGGETSRVVLTSPPLQIEFEIFNDALRSLLQQIKQQMVDGVTTAVVINEYDFCHAWLIMSRLGLCGELDGEQYWRVFDEWCRFVCPCDVELFAFLRVGSWVRPGDMQQVARHALASRG